MGKFLLKMEKINLKPKDYPLNRLKPTFFLLKKYLKNNIGPILVSDMNKTVRGWSSPPKMVKAVTTPYGTRLQLAVYPKGRGTTQWSRINQGTHRRIIKARTPKGMSFRPNYIPMTTPSGSYGGPGSYSGPVLRRISSVSHEIEPRHFTRHILNKRRRKIHNDVRRIAFFSRL